MESLIKKLARIIKFTGIKASYFYSIAIESNCINMQGNYNFTLAKHLKKLKFKPEIDTNGYALFYRGDITIVLT